MVLISNRYYNYVLLYFTLIFLPKVCVFRIIHIIGLAAIECDDGVIAYNSGCSTCYDSHQWCRGNDQINAVFWIHYGAIHSGLDKVMNVKRKACQNVTCLFSIYMEKTTIQ